MSSSRFGGRHRLWARTLGGTWWQLAVLAATWLQADHAAAGWAPCSACSAHSRRPRSDGARARQDGLQAQSRLPAAGPWPRLFRVRLAKAIFGSSPLLPATTCARQLGLAALAAYLPATPQPHLPCPAVGLQGGAMLLPPLALQLICLLPLVPAERLRGGQGMRAGKRTGHWSRRCLPPQRKPFFARCDNLPASRGRFPATPSTCTSCLPMARAAKCATLSPRAFTASISGGCSAGHKRGGRAASASKRRGRQRWVAHLRCTSDRRLQLGRLPCSMRQPAGAPSNATGAPAGSSWAAPNPAGGAGADLPPAAPPAPPGARAEPPGGQGCRPGHLPGRRLRRAAEAAGQPTAGHACRPVGADGARQRVLVWR